MRTHEVPTHLHVEDQLLAGLTVRQALYVVVGGAVGYWLWQQTAVPVAPRAACAGVAGLVGLALAVVRPGGCSLGTWITLVLAYVLRPHHAVWGRAPATPPATGARNWRRERWTTAASHTSAPGRAGPPADREIVA